MIAIFLPSLIAELSSTQVLGSEKQEALFMPLDPTCVRALLKIKNPV
jgi:hypothetical protein